MIDEDYKLLEELGPDKIRQIAGFIEKVIQDKPQRKRIEVVTGGQERIIKLQLRAFERMPGELIARYMTDEEQQEYDILRDAY